MFKTAKDEGEMVDWGTIQCPEGKVPGWLDEQGNPTGCVDNQTWPTDPTVPVEEPEVPEAPTEEPGMVVPEHTLPEVGYEVAQEVSVPAEMPSELAVTGPDDAVLALLFLGAVAMVSAGSWLMRLGRVR